jgi:hypothetical protein
VGESSAIARAKVHIARIAADSQHAIIDRPMQNDFIVKRSRMPDCRC